MRVFRPRSTVVSPFFFRLFLNRHLMKNPAVEEECSVEKSVDVGDISVGGLDDIKIDVRGPRTERRDWGTERTTDCKGLR